ncbi:hypothetical protein GCM10022280_08780 [Sphingomonas swuensis]|uniref:Capsule biosynthesis protein n=1 Tax=Sphingomonas swuensis TaxID=977800 RepID=A0ABP7SKD7_9SPHN
MRFFTEHPESVGESYGEHLLVASSFGASMIAGGIACLIHGLVPGLFMKTGSDTIRRLNQRMVTHRQRKPETLPGLDYVI